MRKKIKPVRKNTPDSAVFSELSQLIIIAQRKMRSTGRPYIELYPQQCPVLFPGEARRCRTPIDHVCTFRAFGRLRMVCFCEAVPSSIP